VTVGRDSALLTGAQVYYKLTGFLVYPLLSAAMPESDVGLFFLAVSTAQILLVVASGNLAPVVVRRLRGGSPASVEIPAFVAFRLASGPLFLGACALAAAIYRPSAAPAIVAAAGFVLLEDVYAAAAAILLASDRTATVVRIGLAVQTTYLLSLWLGLALHPALETVFLAQLVRTGCLVVLGGWAVSRLAPLRPRRAPGFFAGAAPFALLLLASSLFSEIDPLVLGAFTGLDEIARYGLAQKVVAGTFFFPGVLATVFYAKFAGATTQEARTMFGRLLLVVVAVCGGGALFLALLAGPIAGFFFPRAPGVAGPLVLLAPCVLLGGLATFGTAGAQAFGRERGALAALVAGALAGIAGDALLVPARGAEGAALARSVATFVQCLALGLLLFRGSPRVPSGET
jgi:O-antigen/teichoic acid export membrane protein